MMLRQAIEAFGPRTLLPVALIGGAVLTAGALLLPANSAPARFQLLLTAPVQPNTFYVSAWAEGDVVVDHDGSDGRPIVFTRRAEERDGCTWQGIERLVPLSASTYHYSYSEQILSCRPGARPFNKSPRIGLVSVEKMDGDAELTELTGVQAPYDIDNFDTGADLEVEDDDFAELRAAADEAMAEAEQAVKDAEELADDASAAVEELSARPLAAEDEDDEQ